MKTRVLTSVYLITFWILGVLLEKHGQEVTADGHIHDEAAEEIAPALTNGIGGFLFRASERSCDNLFYILCQRGKSVRGHNAIYGIGGQRIWNDHTEHGHDDTEFGNGAYLLRPEIMGRNAQVVLEDGNAAEFYDYGITTALHYGAFR